MKKKKAYTLLEILIVVLIVGILAWLTRNLLNTARQDKISLGENCSNYIFGKLSSFSSSINYGNSMWKTTTNILYYKISYTPTKIELGAIISWDSFSIYDTISLSTGLKSNITDRCNSNSYSLLSTGAVGMQMIWIPVKGKPLPAPANNISSRFIGTWGLQNTLNTGNIEFFVCDKNSTSTNDSSCISASKILFDRRSQQIFLQKCLSRNSSTGKCSSRPSGF